MELEALREFFEMARKEGFPYQLRVTLFLNSNVVVSGVMCSLETYEEGLRNRIPQKLYEVRPELFQFWNRMQRSQEAASSTEGRGNHDSTGDDGTIYLKDATLHMVGKEWKIEWWRVPQADLIGFNLDVEDKQDVPPRNH